MDEHSLPPAPAKPPFRTVSPVSHSYPLPALSAAFPGRWPPGHRFQGSREKAARDFGRRLAILGGSHVPRNIVRADLGLLR